MPPRPALTDGVAGEDAEVAEKVKARLPAHSRRPVPESYRSPRCTAHELDACAPTVILVVVADARRLDGPHTSSNILEAVALT